MSTESSSITAFLSSMRDPFVRFQTDITTLCMTFYVTNVRSTSLFVIDKFGVVNKIRFMQGILDNSDIKTYINREEKNSNGVFIVNRYTIPERSAIDLSNNLEHNPNLMLLKSEEITQRFREIVKNRSMIANDIVFSIVTFVPFDLIVNNNGNYYDPASQVTLTTSLDLKTENNTNRDRISSLSIELDLVDADNPSRARYIPIGNKVEKIFPNSSSNLENGVYLRTTKSGIVVNEMHVKLSNAAKLGVYDNEYDADPESQIEYKKRVLEHITSENKLRAVELDGVMNMIKFNHDVEKIRMTIYNEHQRANIEGVKMGNSLLQVGAILAQSLIKVLGMKGAA